MCNVCNVCNAESLVRVHSQVVMSTSSVLWPLKFLDNTLCVIMLSGQLYTNIGLTQACPNEQGSCTMKDGVKISCTSTRAHALCVVIVQSSYKQFLTSLQMVTTCQYYSDRHHIESPGRSKTEELRLATATSRSNY